MGYQSLFECVRDLERTKQLVRISVEVNPDLEAAEIHRRVNRAGGPAILFTNVKGCRFPVLSNLFGTLKRTEFLFRDQLEAVRRMIELKVDPHAFIRNPLRYARLPITGLHTLVKSVKSGPVVEYKTTISELPQVRCWPKDGGPFITLPQVYSEDALHPGFSRSNLGMYRVQLAGNEYANDREVGLHYQIHRGIGVHHSIAKRLGVPFRVNIFVGGPPAMAVAAVMPLPEGLSELIFAGALGGRRVRMISRPSKLPIAADADFCITGVVDPDRTLPEGPFGDHLGYYANVHDFPVLKVDEVYHRSDAIWPFTVVGRPPQEDTSFGEFIHKLTGPVIPTVVHGVHAVHAVDAAGVHPLLLAIGSERYTPYNPLRKPQELLTCANAILGQGQLSLAKYLFIIARQDAPELDIHDIRGFFAHLLERIDWTTDLHFQTSTTIDTLDYSGDGLNQGSKVVLAAVGPNRRILAKVLPAALSLPEGFSDPRLCQPGIVTIKAPPYSGGVDRVDRNLQRFCEMPIDGHWLCSGTPEQPAGDCLPLVVLVDDSEFAAATLDNFLWVTFTRSNPAADIHGLGEFTQHKHWGCRGPLVIDARIKPHHAPPLEVDADVARRVDAMAVKGGPLHGLV